MKTIDVPEKALALIAIKARTVEAMDLDDLRALISWCEWQAECLWSDLSPQELLNIYRVSAEWTTWTAWCEEDEAAAVRAFNRAVKPSHRLLRR